MKNQYPEASDNKLVDEAAAIGAKLAERTTQLKGSASELGRRAIDAIDQNLGSAANGLDKAAATLHEKAENLPGVDTISGLTHSAADKLSATAGYVREHDTERMMTGVKRLVRNNPGPSLLAVGVIGFLVGRAFRSSNSE
ncbi:hypothetical protein [Paludibaculum fermentans]|uniref:DUF883 domain-containing protein n=1 Tax=Paludibaculum fermentans TaxID=1473598 RepID=A0A7S7SK74_PALFE|nr:hypothetical protein [Paludibaculum fermentans]QOY86725.1 hypothetical protein IRI77_28655 [Paludibaculum fermentans]